MKFGLVYPTRRPHCIEDVVKLWEGRAGPRAEYKWCVGVNATDVETATRARQLGLRVAAAGANYVAGVNAAAQVLLAECDVLIVVSDDFVPALRWDEALTGVINEWARGKGTVDFVVLVHDGGEGSLATLPIVGTDRVTRFGYLLYPGYASLFSDTELTYRANLDGVLIDARHLLFEHMHPVNQKRPEDSVDREHASTARWDAGKILFNDRMALGFAPDHNPSDVPPVRLEKYIASLQVTRDDVCLKAVVDSLFDSGVRNFMFNMPRHHWDGSEVSDDDHQQVIRVAQHLIERGAWYCRCGRDSLAPVFWPGMARGQLETHYRNFCLSRLRLLGFKHQLIVDGDEIFMPGALAALDWSVRTLHPETAAMRGVPLAGLPAVAVDGATDRILCYMGATDQWRDVRSPHKPTLDIPHVGVLHLSAVRRTREEIVAKMRKSGHYDDGLYHFEDWIKNTLPNLKPGMKNVHMYKDGSIWPAARELTAREWAAIPVSMHPMIWQPGPAVIETPTANGVKWELKK